MPYSKNFTVLHHFVLKLESGFISAIHGSKLYNLFILQLTITHKEIFYNGFHYLNDACTIHLAYNKSGLLMFRSVVCE